MTDPATMLRGDDPADRPQVEHTLTGCRPEPLGAYLQALGVLRLVAEQADPEITGRWSADAFIVRTWLDERELVDFFLDRYVPTPVLSPWNSGSGFDSNTDALERIEATTTERLADYRAAIAVARRLLSERSVPLSTGDKPGFIRACRAWLPDAAVRWLDAAVALTGEDPAYSPVLGSGGNDGRLEFSNTFMQRLGEVLCLLPGRRAPTPDDSLAWLREALWQLPAPGRKASPGQFDPGAAGGSNSAPTGSAVGIVNPWRYVLGIEGSLLYASATTRRLEAGAHGLAAMPFTFRTSPFGYGSGSSAEQSSSRGEVWAPLWGRPATVADVTRLFAEGRCSWRGRTAHNAMEAAKAAASLGVDRGVSGFGRHVLVPRFGRSYTAVPAGRIDVRERAGVTELAQLDAWTDRFRRLAELPAGIAMALRVLDGASFEVTRRGPGFAVQEVLIAAAGLERLLARSGSIRRERGVPPVQGLRADQWGPVLRGGGGDGVELRLALAFASQRDVDEHGRRSRSPRTLLSPVRMMPGGRVDWSDDGHEVPMASWDVATALAAARVRRALEVASIADAGQGARSGDGGGESPGVLTAYERGVAAPLADLRALLRGEYDAARLSALVQACLLLDFDASMKDLAVEPGSDAEDSDPLPVLDLLAPFHVSRNRDGSSGAPRLVPSSSWPSLLAANRVEDVVRDALHRLRVSGMRPLIANPAAVAAGVDGRRLSAALFTPIPPGRARQMLHYVAEPAAVDQPSNLLF